MERVTSREILDKLGLESARTLRRWRELNLIPPPETGPHPSGRGRIASWPRWVLDRCLEIRRLTREGHTLKEIGEMLGSDWEKAKRKRRYRFRDAMLAREKEMRQFRLEEIVRRRLRKLIRHYDEKYYAGLVTLDILDHAVKLVNDGYNPVFVVTEKRVTVVPDFIVSQHLAADTDSEPLFVIPIGNLVLTDDADHDATVRPASKIVRKAGTRSSQESYRYIGDWEFKMLDDRRG